MARRNLDWSISLRPNRGAGCIWWDDPKGGRVRRGYLLSPRDVRSPQASRLGCQKRPVSTGIDPEFSDQSLMAVYTKEEGLKSFFVPEHPSYGVLVVLLKSGNAVPSGTQIGNSWELWNCRNSWRAKNLQLARRKRRSLSVASPKTQRLSRATSATTPGLAVAGTRPRFSVRTKRYQFSASSSK